MTFLSGSAMGWFVAIVCAVGGMLWIWLEFCRPNRRQRILRIMAALLAVLALTSLGLRPATTDHEPATAAPAPEEAVLLTPSILPPNEDLALPRSVTPERVFALASTKDRPTDAVVVPDVAFIVREYPNVKTLHVFGGGVNGFDTEVLRGIRVVFHSTKDKLASPAIDFVRLPREVSVGNPIILQGRVMGIATGTTASLSLSAPDGTSRVVTLAPSPDGASTFSISAPPAVAVGRFVWRLELRAGDAGKVLASENVGISVIKPVVPRILMLEAAPRFDTGRLGRWLGERGADLTVRTQLGRDRYRITTSQGAREAVEEIDASALTAFDLVVADSSVLAALGDAERAALRAAVSDEGLGVLIVADELLFHAASAPAGAGPRDEFFFPWKINRVGREEDGDERTSRLRWLGGESAASEALVVPSFEIEPNPRLQPLVRDAQDRTLVAGAARGRGRVSLSLVSQTWRWTQLADSVSFAAYWSFLFSELARRDADPAGRWSIVSNGSGPQFENEPVILEWSGARDRAPMPASASALGDAKAERLPLAQSPIDPRQWRATYWPRRAGWHEVAAPGGGANLDFYVSESAAWKTLQAARLQAATTRLAATFADGELAPVAIPPTSPTEFGRWWSYVLLFASLTYLWSEARSLRRSLPRAEHIG
jgi:hypothetical protein